MPTCNHCHRKVNHLLFRCHYCGKHFCDNCRLPEQHNCKGLKHGNIFHKLKHRQHIDSTETSSHEVNVQPISISWKIRNWFSRRNHKPRNFLPTSTSSPAIISAPKSFIEPNMLFNLVLSGLVFSNSLLNSLT